MSGTLISLNVGMPEQLTYGKVEYSSGINKHPVQEELFLTFTNLDGDGQADLRFHGGPDKAVCVYCMEHYPYWERELKLPSSLSFGAFGENMTVKGLTEKEVCIGDIYAIGGAEVQVSQPRQPCHKLAKKHGLEELPVHVQDTGYTGYYFRVLKEGKISAGAQFKLLRRHPLGVTVEFANQVKYHDKDNREALERLLAVEELSAAWRSSLTARLT